MTSEAWIHQVTKNAVQLLERIRHESRRQSRPNRFAARLDQTFPARLCSKSRQTMRYERMPTSLTV
jgi:hypothetical protein